MSNVSRKTFSSARLVAAGAGFLAVVAGCSNEIDPGAGLNGGSDLAGGSVLSGGSENKASDPLAELTAGDVVMGFQRFAVGAAADLSEEQRFEIESAQAELSAARLHPREFDLRIQGIIGDSSPNKAFAGFGFFGCPFGGNRSDDLAEMLALTAEQLAAAGDIFDALHADIAALRDAAHEDIRGVLTEEQRALLDELEVERQINGFFGRHGWRRHVRGFLFEDRLADELDLTEEQQTQIETIRESLRTAIEERHEQAREAFRALLTPEQLAILDEFESES